jgi:hypothetical protein
MRAREDKQAVSRLLKSHPPSFRTPRSGDPESVNAKTFSRAGFRVRAFSAPRNDGARQSAASAAFSVALGRLAADVLAQYGR